jgi:hypothetical protein
MIRGLILAVALMAAPAAHGQEDDEFYAELDEFATAHLDSIQQMSFDQDVEFCGYIGLDENQQLVATPPARGLQAECDIPESPPGLDVWASYHTHGGYAFDADSEVPSLDDLLGDIAEGVDGYIATPGGRVWLNVASERSAMMLCGPGCVRADSDFEECGAFMPEEEYTVQTLQRRFDNDPGTC